MAYCETVCPSNWDEFKIPNGLFIQHTESMYSVFAQLGSGRIFYVNLDGEHPADCDVIAMHSLLGLSERDAVADERLQTDFWERKFNEECEAHIISIEQYQAKNAALVEVLGEVKRYCESGNRGGATRLPASDKFRAEGMYQEVIEALAANEKGGANG